jgi:site-specific recombinase XerD
MLASLVPPSRCSTGSWASRRSLVPTAARNWHDNDLMFATRTGTALGAGNVRRAFRTVAATAGLTSADWTPRELRHSFVSLMSDAGVPIEKIARLVGHIGTATTEAVYRKQLRPVVTGGAEVMDRLFPKRGTDV